LLLSGDDPSYVAAALRRAVTDAALRRVLVDAGRRRAAMLTPDMAAPQFVAAVAGVAGSAGSAP
jgi:hypothetical protein